MNIIGFNGSVEWGIGNSTSLDSNARIKEVRVKEIGFLIIVINKDNQYELRSKYS